MIDERRIQSGDNRRTPYLLWMWRMLLSPNGANGDSPGCSVAQPWVTGSAESSSPEGANQSGDGHENRK